MKKSILVAFLASLFSVGYSFATLENINATPGYDKLLHIDTRISLLFVQTAQSGKIKLLDQNKQIYQLALHDMPSEIIYFSDRPYRIANKMNIQKFVQGWESGTFAKNHPNAALVYDTNQQQLAENFIELLQVKWDEKTRTLTYLIKPIDGKYIKTGPLIQPTLFIE